MDVDLVQLVSFNTAPGGSRAALRAGQTYWPAPVYASGVVRKGWCDPAWSC